MRQIGRRTLAVGPTRTRGKYADLCGKSEWPTALTLSRALDTRRKSVEKHAIVEAVTFMLRSLVVCLLASLVCPAVPAAQSAPASKPQRIASLYLCADELLLQLTDRRNVASVTFLARDPLNSNVAGLAAQVPVNRGRAEEIFAQRPDVVLAGAFTARPAVAMLKRAGLPIGELCVPQTLDDVRHDIRTIADAIGERENGERMIARIDTRLAALPPPAATPRRSAIVLNPNGFTIGAGSLVDEIF